MQLYAFDLKGDLVNARQAQRQIDYQCVECKEMVRLRGGPHRQRHFYHVEPTPFCRQHQKGAAHLQIQSYFLQELTPQDCQLECSFPSVGRIADVAWLSRKIVFEIQCSPITGDEVMARNADYQKMGWQVVWILHDKRYNQLRLSSAEFALRSSPHFFTNMDEQGCGIIYDQFDICEKGVRLKKLSPLPIRIKDSVCPLAFDGVSFPLTKLQKRLRGWNHFFGGDLMHAYLANKEDDYWVQAREMEELVDSKQEKIKWNQIPALIWKRAIALPYQVLFRFLLEKMCRF